MGLALPVFAAMQLWIGDNTGRLSHSG